MASLDFPPLSSLLHYMLNALHIIHRTRSQQSSTQQTSGRTSSQGWPWERHWGRPKQRPAMASTEQTTLMEDEHKVPRTGRWLWSLKRHLRKELVPTSSPSTSMRRKSQVHSGIGGWGKWWWEGSDLSQFLHIFYRLEHWLQGRRRRGCRWRSSLELFAALWKEQLMLCTDLHSYAFSTDNNQLDQMLQGVYNTWSCKRIYCYNAN